ncbi:uncharacterized protein LOC111286513 [Durio zibethinus]|uniref:Uncharacterized protein LOC111286513 n=1 Tax=Durio zibethinus TaxID=66656 RepID=A0A6P5XVM4_DURZI|nr:uncharacterized protein LOC111286513 [Durio zibethinus]XP_022732255.1 uncharacterized protein LOC111286513 [Durio zibethinus]
MAGSIASSPIQETDITVLNETLRSQQQLLQKLYAELDVERESSATATNEALSMILRLQGEKAALKMEASQYKRLAEEKICHAEESLAIFEDLMYQKEMEISSLEYQIQAYKYKLLSLGCDDLGDTGTPSFPENTYAEKNDAFPGEKGFKATVRRLSSLPATLPTDFHQKKTTSDGEKYPTPVPDLFSRIVAGKSDLVVRDQSLDSKRSSVHSAAGDFDSYWEQIRMLDEKVKEISDCKEVGQNNFSKVKVESGSRSTSSFTDPSRANFPPKCHNIKTYEDSLERAISSAACSSSIVHDIFEVPDIIEVPESSEKNKTCFNGEKCQCKPILEGDNRLKKPDLILEETLESPEEDVIDWIKMNNFLNAKPEKKLCKLRDEMNADCKSPDEYETEWVKKNSLLGANHEKRLCKQRDQTTADCKSALLGQASGVIDYRSKLQQLTQRVEQLESERNNTRHEISEGREEELNFLKELREQLNSIQSEMKSWRPKKSSPSDEVTLLPLTEAMLYFWM